jgi:hypothetical protein
MESSQPIQLAQPRRSSVNALTVLLCLIMVFFCAVLVFVYVATKRANPMMLDQQGRPMQPSSQQHK